MFLKYSLSATGSVSSIPFAVSKSFYKNVVDHKEVVRSMMALQGAIIVLKPDIQKLIEVQI